MCHNVLDLIVRPHSVVRYNFKTCFKKMRTSHTDYPDRDTWVFDLLNVVGHF